MRFDTHANRAACSGYVWVQTITGVMLTAAATAVMLAIGLNNVLFWAVIFFLLTFIPNIGVTVGSIAPSLFALVQFKTIWQAITIFLVIQVVATIVGNLIYPRLQAHTQNIDPLPLCCRSHSGVGCGAFPVRSWLCR
jgi:AI-2 transport protein TqsA